MNIDIPSTLAPAVRDWLLSIADDKFVLGHRNADWTGLAPILEEDIAFSSIAQDEISHAAALYEVVAALAKRNADALAYGRRPEEYRCAAIVEVADDFDWAVALVRQFVCDHFDLLRLERLARSSSRELAALGGRLLAEERIHVGHADGWMVRLGQGNEEARAKVQAALTRMAPLAAQLLEPTAGLGVVEKAGLYPAASGPMRDLWADALNNVVEEAGLEFDLPALAPGFVGGRQGRHSPGFSAMMDELSEVYRVEPEAAW